MHDRSIDLPEYVLDFEPGKRCRKGKRSKSTKHPANSEEQPPDTNTEVPSCEVSFSPDTSFTSSRGNLPRDTNEEELGGKRQHETSNRILNNLDDNVDSYKSGTLESSIETEMVTKMNNELVEDRQESSKIGGSVVTKIDSHRWESGQLQFRVHWDSEQSKLGRLSTVVLKSRITLLEQTGEVPNKSYEMGFTKCIKKCCVLTLEIGSRSRQD